MFTALMNTLLFGPGIRYVPDVVWRSSFFWIALIIMIGGILVYHNYFRKKQPSNFLQAFLGLFKLNRPHTPQITYSNQGRSGYVWYNSREASFALYFEFGGNNCVVSIDLPSSEKWEDHTGLPLEQRQGTINFIGTQVVKDQTSEGRGYFKVEGDFLNIYV